MHFDTSVAVGRDHASSTREPSAEKPLQSSSDVFAVVGLIGRAPSMLRLRAYVLRYARSSATVLVTGETGSGKELVAHALHLASTRAPQPFVAVNVATLRPEFAASELFGHERGAFTGAVARRRGLFEQAHGGTLLLDEVGELDLRTQADLLRVLETGEIRPLGGERTRKVDVRVVVATHRNLGTMVTRGLFRADLFQRLNVLPLTVPPLRDRREDLPSLVDHLLGRLRPEVGPRALSPAALRHLRQHARPGNVRELFNVLRRATARNDARVLDAEIIADALGLPPVKERPRNLTHDGLRDALQATRGSVAAAARRLGLPRSTPRDRLRALPSAA